MVPNLFDASLPQNILVCSCSLYSTCNKTVVKKLTVKQLKMKALLMQNRKLKSPSHLLKRCITPPAGARIPRWETLSCGKGTGCKDFCLCKACTTGVIVRESSHL